MPEKTNERFFEEALLLLRRQLEALSTLIWIWTKIEPDDGSWLFKLVNKYNINKNTQEQCKDNKK